MNLNFLLISYPLNRDVDQRLGSMAGTAWHHFARRVRLAPDDPVYIEFIYPQGLLGHLNQITPTGQTSARPAAG